MGLGPQVKNHWSQDILFCLVVVVGGGGVVESGEIIEIKCFLKSEKT